MKIAQLITLKPFDLNKITHEPILQKKTNKIKQQQQKKQTNKQIKNKKVYYKKNYVIIQFHYHAKTISCSTQGGRTE